MCSFDVESLYTYAPFDEAIVDFMHKPREIIDFPLKRYQFRKLLILSLKDAPFPFLDKVYKQINDVAMGNPLASIIVDLWMQKMEQKLNKFSTNKRIIWLRYVDDVYCVFTITNWSKPVYRLQLGFEQYYSIPLLDILVTREENQLTSIYRKSTHTDLYMLWDSF